MHAPSRLIASPTQSETANDRLKRSSTEWLSRSIVIAVALHFAVFALSPTMSVAVESMTTETELMPLPPDLELPPPPKAITRPAEPVPGPADMDPNVTVTPIPFDELKATPLAPPEKRIDEARNVGDWIRTTVVPHLRNPQEVERELVRNYPPFLRDAGIGGTVDVHLWLDETGAVVKSEVAQTSGHAAFDAAALKVVNLMRFSPAMNGAVAARVIVTLPVRFTVK